MFNRVSHIPISVFRRIYYVSSTLGPYFPAITGMPKSITGIIKSITEITKAITTGLRVLPPITTYFRRSYFRHSQSYYNWNSFYYSQFPRIPAEATSGMGKATSTVIRFIIPNFHVFSPKLLQV